MAEPDPSKSPKAAQTGPFPFPQAESSAPAARDAIAASVKLTNGEWFRGGVFIAFGFIITSAALAGALWLLRVFAIELLTAGNK